MLLTDQVAIVTGAAVGLERIGASTGCGVTGTYVVALIERTAHDGIRTRAAAPLASVDLRARVRVGARRAIGFRRIGARAAAGIASRPWKG